MTTPPASSWSESLQQQTRDAIAQLSVTSSGHLHFKHSTLGYAHATLDDVTSDRLLLRAKTGIDVYRFAKVGALLQAGWAID